MARAVVLGSGAVSDLLSAATRNVGPAGEDDTLTVMLAQARAECMFQDSWATRPGGVRHAW
eukprot:6410990-Alexandrium_andersonii.AAC.1